MLELQIASNLEQVENAWALMYAQYRRYETIAANPIGIWTYPQNTNSNNLTLCGYEADELVVTCSAVIDSEHKLPLDKYFSEELDALRAEGRKMMEVGLLADKRDGAKISKLLEVHVTTSGFAMHMGFSDIVLGCDPKSIKYYTAYGLKVIGECKSYDSLSKVPVVLLHGSMKDDTPTNKMYIPFVKELLKKYDMESRYRFPKSELRNSKIEKFFNQQQPTSNGRIKQGSN